MTPEERNLVIELFDRLATLEDAQRDQDAERLIRDGLRQAPNASYALVQTVLVQDEALKRADARIRELEGEPAADAPRDNSFLGGVRDSLFGRREGRGSVPSVPRTEDARGSMSPAWRTGTPAMAPSAGAGMPMGAGQPGGPMAGGGGSFLGTAAAAAAGVVGGSLLLNGIRSMMGGQHGAQAAFDPNAGTTGSSPWGGSAAAAAAISRARPGSTTSDAHPHQVAAAPATAATARSTTAPAKMSTTIRIRTTSTTAMSIPIRARTSSPAARPPGGLVRSTRPI